VKSLFNGNKTEKQTDAGMSEPSAVSLVSDDSATTKYNKAILRKL